MAQLAASPRRRLFTVPAVGVGAIGLTVTAPLWLGLSVIYDLARRPHRLRLTRLFAFAFLWCWLEVLGVLASGWLWATRRAERPEPHYAVQRWWAARLVAALRVTCNLHIEVDGLDVLSPGPIVLCSRHASIPDSLLPAWLLGQVGMRPRYVLKRDLLLDPCLDIVGRRVPNHFVDRDAQDSGPELLALERLAHGMGSRDAAVIFPEGTVTSPRRRERAMAKLAERSPARADRLRPLRHLLPPRPRGTIALLRGAPDTDVVLMTHVGLDGFDRLAGALTRIPLETPVRVFLRRVPRAEVPGPDDLPAWLDDRWLELDAWVDAELEAALTGAGRLDEATSVEMRTP